MIFKIKNFYLTTLVVLLVSILFRIYCSNILAVKNTELKELYSKKETLEKELSKLDYIDSELSSLSYVESRAVELGFVEFHDALLSLKINSPAAVAVVSKN